MPELGTILPNRKQRVQLTNDFGGIQAFGKDHVREGARVGADNGGHALVTVVPRPLGDQLLSEAAYQGLIRVRINTDLFLRVSDS